MGIFSGLLSTNYRTSVLNDFSTVTKATITFVHPVSSGGLMKLGGLKNKETVPVQINPNSINISYDRPKPISSTEMLSSQTKHARYHSNVDKNAKNVMTFSLDYDFYDEYYASSFGGAIGAVKSILGGSSKVVSLKNSQLSSLEKIIQYANSGIKYYTLFKWGSFEFFGIMDNINPSYKAFSPYGEPLKADVNISITETPDESGIQKTALMSAESYTRTAKMVQAATSVISSALR